MDAEVMAMSNTVAEGCSDSVGMMSCSCAISVHQRGISARSRCAVATAQPLLYLSYTMPVRSSTQICFSTPVHGRPCSKVVALPTQTHQRWHRLVRYNIPLIVRCILCSG